MGQALPKNFDFKEAEPRLYERWEKGGYFKPEAAPPNAEPFVIAIPPPNVTGSLHIGHAIFVALQDIMIRYARMRGKAALWIPGMDHASIATQLQVEKLLTSEGLSREALGREKFLERAWAWKNEYGGRIVFQLRSLGASCDWDRERFTMDDGFSDAVLEAFIRLHDQGLIYRGPRLVNWSPGLKTAVSDLEVERTEEIGKLYFFRYPVEGGGFIPVATTRPETILGDTAVAVHPDDPRYQQYIGRSALVPMLDRPIPIIADTYVDSSFGTGALKVTPGHDFNDYQIAQRHNLPVLSIMNRDATINEHGGRYAGLDRFVCREQLWADMQAAGLTIEVRDHPMVVPRAERGGEVIEPLISEQWFVRVAPLAEKAAQAVRDGRIKIVPERFEKVYFHWLDNIEDWCISRQLWWGHRIPVWYGSDGSRIVSRTPPSNDGVTYTQDEDVLDTWFSSGLWPFATLGWYHDTPDLRRFYPTDVLETGYDILFFWVVRMVMFGMWFTDDIPFHTVYLHGLIRDKLGRKISKTLGNVIDPLEYMDKYGADPLRFTLVTSGTPGNDINLDTDKIERNWRFINKIWQMSSFVLSNLDDVVEHGAPEPDELDLPARWIMSRLHHLIESVHRLFDAHLYGEAGRQIDDFLWTEFADWFIEISKHPLYQGGDLEKRAARRVLLTVLDTALRLLHPFMPFVTEELWSYLPHPEADKDRPLIVAAFPEADARYFDTAAEESMARLIDVVRSIRNTRAQYNVEPGRRITALIQPGTHTKALESCGYIFSRLCNVGEYQLIGGDAPPPEKAAVVVSGDITVYLPLADFIDTAAECARLDQELSKIAEQIVRTEAMLGNEQFVSRARPDVVERERARLNDLHASAAQIRERIASLCPG